MSTVTFRVNGDPKSQGSLQHNTYGHAYQKRELLDWRNLIAQTAILACRDAGWTLPLDEPVEVGAMFFLPRPQRPRWEVPATGLDLDKLQRAVGDALSPKRGVKVLINDNRIIRWHPSKHYADDMGPGALITITRTEE